MNDNVGVERRTHAYQRRGEDGGGEQASTASPALSADVPCQPNIGRYKRENAVRALHITQPVEPEAAAATDQAMGTGGQGR